MNDCTNEKFLAIELRAARISISGYLSRVGIGNDRNANNYLEGAVGSGNIEGLRQRAINLAALFRFLITGPLHILHCTSVHCTSMHCTYQLLAARRTRTQEYTLFLRLCVRYFLSSSALAHSVRVEYLF